MVKNSNAEIEHQTCDDI